MRALTNYTHKAIFGYNQPSNKYIKAGTKIATFLAKRFRGGKARQNFYRPGGTWFRHIARKHNKYSSGLGGYGFRSNKRKRS